MDTSSSIQSEAGEKPVIVRVKRKVRQSLLDAFWLEINERPSKRPYLDLSKLSISDSDERDNVKPKKVLVRHLETVADSETSVDLIQSFFESDHEKGKLQERRIVFKEDNRKEQRLTKAVQQQQNARFEQIWRSRNGNKEGIHEKCNFYDVIRVDAEEREDNAPELTSLEDQKMLASYLPLLREFIPTAAEEIEAVIHSSHTEEYVYDYYAVNERMDIGEDSSKHQLPLVKVDDEEDFYDGPDELVYDSDDSNAEDHPRNDYPEEISEEEEEEDDDEEEKSEASDETSDEETSEIFVRRALKTERMIWLFRSENVNGYRDSDDEFEYT